MSARYRVTLRDRLGRRYGILPAHGSTPIQFSYVLNSAGSATVTPNLTLPLISGPNKRERLSAWASEISIERLSGPGLHGLVWEGPVTKPKADLDGDSLSITAANAWAWLDERDIDARHAYGGWDQLDVARDLIRSYTTAKGGAWDIRMDLGSIRSGVKVTEQYGPADNKNVAGAVEDLAGASNGFDFEVVSTIDPATQIPRRAWQAYYPQKGRTILQRLTRGRGGLRSFTVEEATQIATRVRGSGQIAYSKNLSAAVEARYGVHSRSIALTDSNSAAKLRAQVDDYLRYRTPPVDIVSFSWVVSDAVPFGAILTGDSVPVVAERGWASYDNTVRVIGISYSVDKNGVEIANATAAGIPGGVS